MANYPVRVVISGQITVNDVTAEALEYLCSFDLQKWFVENCSKRYTPEQLQEGTRELRSELGRIIRARDAAQRAVTAEFTPKPRD